jgi:hypothetical protein
MTKKDWFTMASGMALVLVAALAQRSQLISMAMFSVWAVLVVVIVLILFFMGRGAGHLERVAALERAFGEFKQSIAVQRGVNLQGREIWIIITGDHLNRRAFESACDTAVRTVSRMRRVKSFIPAHVWAEPDRLSIWVSILNHLQLREPSGAEKLYPNLPPGKVVFKSVEKASVEGCKRIKDLLD